MNTSTQQKVPEKRVVMIAHIALASRETMRRRNVIPTTREVAGAKARFLNAKVTGIICLMDMVLMMETPQSLVGYIGFSLQSPNLYDWQTAETEAEYIMKLMHLPCTSFGRRDGTCTVLGDMIKLSHNPQLVTITPRQRANLSSGFERTSHLLAEATGIGRMQ